MICPNDTFGHLLESNWSVYIYCESSTWCHHWKKMDVKAMAARYGMDHGSLHKDLIKLPWKCEKCGGRKVSFKYQPGGKQYDYGKDAGPDWFEINQD